ncbi:MAG: Na+/H+ antiporter subunit E [Candidatus Aenigmatarchaeota archaeon]
MKIVFLLFILLWVFWILLNGFAFWEIVIGGLISFCLSLIFWYLFAESSGKNYIKRFFIFLGYIPYYLFQEIKCVLDVSYRIISGKISPVIVEVPHNHETPLGVTFLANSITMTPGTLTLEAEEGRLYVHWLNEGKDKKEISKTFDKFLNKIWG